MDDREKYTITDLFSGQRKDIRVQIGDVYRDPNEKQNPMVLNDVLNFEKNHPDIMERDINNYYEFVNAPLKDVKENLSKYKENLIKMADNPCLGDLFIDYYTKFQIFLSNEEIDMLMNKRAEQLHKVTSETYEKDWEKQVEAHDTYLKVKPDESLPLGHYINRERLKHIKDEESRVNAALAAYEKAKKTFENESVYKITEGKGEDGIARLNVMAKNVVAVTEDGRTVHFNNRELAKMKLENKNKLNMQNNNNNAHIIDNDDDMVEV